MDNRQVTLLEGRDKCEMKLTKPLKFRTGRRDCKTGEDRKYVTQEDEVGLKGRKLSYFLFSCILIHGETGGTWLTMVARPSVWIPNIALWRYPLK